MAIRTAQPQSNGWRNAIDPATFSLHAPPCIFGVDWSAGSRLRPKTPRPCVPLQRWTMTPRGPVVVASGVVNVIHKDGHVRSATATHVVWSVGLTYRLHVERAIP